MYKILRCELVYRIRVDKDSTRVADIRLMIQECIKINISLMRAKICIENNNYKCNLDKGCLNYNRQDQEIISINNKLHLTSNNINFNKLDRDKFKGQELSRWSQDRISWENSK